MRFIRQTISALIYFVVGIIIIVLAFRLFADLIDVGARLPLLIQISDYFLRPFFGLVSPVDIIGVRINLTGIVAIFSYIFLANILEQVLTSVFFWDIRIIFIEIVMSFFKIVEGFIGYRLLLKILAGSNGNAIRVFVNSYTDWFINPLNSVFPQISILNGHIETSSIAALIFIFVIDVIVEFLLVNLLLVNRRV